MEWWQILIYVLLFAIIIGLLYIWGVVKSQSKQRDLINALYGKGETVVLHALKRQGTMTKEQLDEALGEVKASLFYSKHKVKVTDPAVFCDTLLKAMCNKGTVQTVTKDGVLQYQRTKRGK